MYQEPIQPLPQKPKPVRLRKKSQNATDAIVWAAYKKFVRGGKAREAMQHCLKEDRANAKRREQT